jgi:hypothetical protein
LVGAGTYGSGMRVGRQHALNGNRRQLPPHKRQENSGVGFVGRMTADDFLVRAMTAIENKFLFPHLACAVIRRRFPVGESPTWLRLQPVATGAVMEVTK